MRRRQLRPRSRPHTCRRTTDEPVDVRKVVPTDESTCATGRHDGLVDTCDDGPSTSAPTDAPTDQERPDRRAAGHARAHDGPLDLRRAHDATPTTDARPQRRRRRRRRSPRPRTRPAMNVSTADTLSDDAPTTVAPTADALATDARAADARTHTRGSDYAPSDGGLDDGRVHGRADGRLGGRVQGLADGVARGRAHGRSRPRRTRRRTCPRTCPRTCDESFEHGRACRRRADGIRDRDGRAHGGPERVLATRARFAVKPVVPAKSRRRGRADGRIDARGGRDAATASRQRRNSPPRPPSRWERDGRWSPTMGSGRRDDGDGSTRRAGTRNEA